MTDPGPETVVLIALAAVLAWLTWVLWGSAWALLPGAYFVIVAVGVACGAVQLARARRR